jgi:phosphatidate cytidylyltransferase
LGLFALAGAWEWRRVGCLGPRAGALFLALMTATLAAGPLLAGGGPALWGVLGAAVAWWALALAWVLVFQRGGVPAGLEHLGVRVVVGWLLLAPCYLSLVWLHAQRPALVMYVLVLIWVADSAAFFAGRRFGRRRLADRVSPGKSWEGVAGGLLGVILLAVAVAAAAGATPLAAPVFVALSLAVAAASVLGDLVESLFKRRAGVKDSGKLIPGHGGVLDRIDSLTAAGPFFAAGWLVLGALS